MPHTPFLIFFRNGGKRLDEFLFKSLRIENIESIPVDSPAHPTSLTERRVYMAEQGDWACWMDDWFYTLWHTKAIWKLIEKLAEQYEVFYCYTGDADDSLGFAHYQNGILRRKLIIDEIWGKPPHVTEDTGTPFPGEQAALAFHEPVDTVHALMKEVGINMKFNNTTVRAFSYPVFAGHPDYKCWD